MRDYAAIILAAGLSSRMGRFKPLLTLGRTTVLERVIGLYRMAGLAQVKVVMGHRAQDLLPVAREGGASPVLNPAFQDGMFSSVAAGAASLEPGTKAFFVHPVDIPLVSLATVRELGLAFAQGGAKVVYPTFGGRRGHPPLISADLAAPLCAWQGPEGLRGFLRQHERRAMELTVADGFILRDMDLPEEYQALASQVDEAAPKG